MKPLHGRGVERDVCLCGTKLMLPKVLGETSCPRQDALDEPDIIGRERCT